MIRALRTARAVAATELRLASRDPGPVAVLVLMPTVVMSLVAPAIRPLLAEQGYAAATGAEQAVPGMAVMFAFFGAAFFGFGVFREHAWHTWDRLRSGAAGVGPALAGKAAATASMLVLQQCALLAFGRLVFDMRISGTTAALAAVVLAFSACVVAIGLMLTALCRTIQQLNALTNVGALAFAGLGGAFVPVEVLPAWLKPLAPISPAYWAMSGFREVLLRNGDLGSVAAPLAVLAGIAVLCGAIGLARFRVSDVKTTWA